MQESEVPMLINYLQSLPQRIDAPKDGFRGRPHDEYRAIFTDDQRNYVIEALRHYHPR